MPYLYETHLHTCQSSACAVSTGAEHVRRYKAMGYRGVVITDHFFGGNCAVPRALPWAERVRRFCAGYEDALAEGARVGLDVFFGWEQGYGDDEYLVYGLDKAWLLAHPEVERWTRREQLEHVRADGGCVVQAHPFRMRDYMRHICLGLRYCDGAEVANAGNDAISDTYAYRYAREYGLAMTAGTDNHFSGAGSPAPSMGVVLDSPMTEIGELARLIREKRPIGLHVPEGRFDVPRGAPGLTSYWLDENERLRPTGRRWDGDLDRRG